MTKRITQVIDLVNQGMSDQEIAAELGTTIPSVKSAKHRARKDGLIPPHKPKGGYGNFVARIQRENARLGTMQAMLSPLSDEQRDWLLTETQDTGCESISEYIRELIRDAHAESVG
jgi:predicted transcriptional regulator